MATLDAALRDLPEVVARVLDDFVAAERLRARVAALT
jgi:hypothetical protein